MSKNSVNWHSADILAAISKKGGSLSSVARIHQIHASTVSKALRFPCLTGEAAIASFLELKPKVIWPNRYDSHGKPRHPRAHMQSNVTAVTDASQKSVA
ncbi:helix-turn-helix domain-containing protein [Epibacterium ulvae]|uniref:helix-turn-helix domain-containing protein n=1 Tax=Epibacterium ulvae TaxID=1156985 RepID=UPI00249154FB|nr:helix-turn-helix domain-containing protein [Epibacterium ulvae]